jgi:hypothetical protein
MYETAAAAAGSVEEQQQRQQLGFWGPYLAAGKYTSILDGAKPFWALGGKKKEEVGGGGTSKTIYSCHPTWGK